MLLCAQVDSQRQVRGRSPVVLDGQDGQLPSQFLDAACSLAAADPRVASVSLADSAIAQLLGPVSHLDQPHPGPPQWIHAGAPAGSAVVVFDSGSELTQFPTAGAWDVATLTEWALRANHRGLRHLWWSTLAPTTTAPLVIPIGELDRRESHDPLSPLACLLTSYRARNARLTLRVEGSRLGPHETGGQVATVSWLAALARREDVAAIELLNLPDGLPDYARVGSDRVVAASGALDQADIFWRPFQPDPDTTLSVDRGHARRLVTTYLDLIEFSHERYNGGLENWYPRRRQFRRYTRQVDGITGISQDVLDHLQVEVPGLEVGRLHRTPLGVEHLAGMTAVAPPAEVAELASDGANPFLLVLGNDFLHKNRDLALAAWCALDPATPVDLVLAGLHVGPSSTAEMERQVLAAVGPGPGRLVTLQHVSSQAKTWLLANAALVLYPTSAEGFGFVPHEAAVLGTATVYTEFGPLAEFLPGGLADWSVQRIADRIAELLADPAAASAVTARAIAAGTELTWDAAADRLMAAFRATMQQPPQPWGLWERTEGGDPGFDPSVPLPPAAVAEALARAKHGRHWRVRASASRARRFAGRVRRRLRAGVRRSDS